LSPPEAKVSSENAPIPFASWRFNNELSPYGLERLVESGRPALTISPVEIEVFIEAGIRGAGGVTS